MEALDGVPSNLTTRPKTRHWASLVLNFLVCKLPFGLKCSLNNYSLNTYGILEQRVVNEKKKASGLMECAFFSEM
jgi:hypothetical protein